MAIEYLSTNQEALKELANYSGVTSFILGLQYQIDLDESVVGFCMGPSKQLMKYALDIGITLTFFVSLERFEMREDESGIEKESQPGCHSRVFRSNRVRHISENHEKNLPVLAVTGFLIEEGLNDEELCQVQNKLFNLVNYSLEKICTDIPKVTFLNGFSYVYLDLESENCFQCEHCGNWATNQEKPNEIQGLPAGREFEGMMLCDQCECWKHDPYHGWGREI